MDTSGKAWVVMPLYIYPLTETMWGPLYDVIAAFPDVNFMVIVNPNSGPGDAELPSHDYVREVPKLNAFANVLTVGYVRIDYCRRPLESSYDDIRLFAGWHRDAIPGLYVEGIYVDETPNHVSDERAQYLSATTRFIKNCAGLLGERLVVHNPGTPPEGSLDLFGNPDLVCISEEPYKLYCGDGVQQRLQQYSPGWGRALYQISGIPLQDMDAVVPDLCARGQYVFATDLVDDFYESFGSSWKGFVAAVSKRNKALRSPPSAAA